MQMWLMKCFFNLVIYLVLITYHCNCIPIDNALVGAEIHTECLADRAVDFAIIMDGSTSVQNAFRIQKQFVNNILDQLGNNFGFDGVRVGIVQYSDNPQLELELGQSDNKHRIQRTINRIQMAGGATYTGAALNFTQQTVFSRSRGGDVPKVALIITDGKSQDDVKTAAEALQHSDVLVYAIGVTDAVNINELYLIAGTPQRAFTVKSFQELNENFSQMIVKEMCKTNFEPGLPEIMCSSDRIGVRATTKNAFEGVVFVKDYFHNENCRIEPHQLRNPKRVAISLLFTQCGIKRYRSLHPRGIFVEMTVIFMFHPFFMTKVDQAVKVQCFYMEAEKTVQSPLEVSMLPTLFASQTYPMPSCTYSLHKDSANGPLVTHAAIGQKVVHAWRCTEFNEKYDVFGMLVHDCFVDDGQGDTVDILDHNGCSLDLHLLPTPKYEVNLRLATSESHVFKYADRFILQFRCQISICYKHDGACTGLTPPKCSNNQRVGFLRQKREIVQDKNDHVSADFTIGVNSDILKIINEYADVLSKEERSCLVQTWKTLLVTLVCVFTIICTLFIIIVVSYRFRNSG